MQDHENSPCAEAVDPGRSLSHLANDVVPTLACVKGMDTLAILHLLLVGDNELFTWFNDELGTLGISKIRDIHPGPFLIVINPLCRSGTSMINTVGDVG